jgi:hypothetical protein
MANMVMLNLYPYYGHAPSIRGAFVLLMYVVIDRGQLVAWSVVSGGM